MSLVDAEPERCAAMNGRSRTHLAALVAASVLLTCLFARATGGFEHWTFESLRRAQAAQGGLQAPDVQLIDTLGRASRPWAGRAPGDDRPARGDVLIVDFVFTRCTTVCQSLGTAFQQMQAQLESDRPAARRPSGGAGVRLLTISFDPGHDDVVALQAYAQRHRADPSLWTVAVPSSMKETQRLLRALGVVVIPDGWVGYTHNAGLHVVDGDGRLAAIYDLDAWPRALSHARALSVRESP